MPPESIVLHQSSPLPRGYTLLPHLSTPSAWVAILVKWPLLQVRLMSRSILDRAAWLLFSAMTISNVWSLGRAALIVCFVIYYNAAPLLHFVLIIELSCMVWNKWFVNYVMVSLPLLLLWCICIWINCCNTAWLCNVILLENRGWFGVLHGHPTVFLSTRNICIGVKGRWTVTGACGP